ncbi:MAG: type IV secretion system DNA-binding domain-containing protein [Bdellovibrionales bacterium]|nr:type IV secretion system DNA-binding domain-containing protein [Bdellovibrionales bacterium]
MENSTRDEGPLYLTIFGICLLEVYSFYTTLTPAEVTLLGITSCSGLIILGAIFYHFFSKQGRERRKNLKIIKTLPKSLVTQTENCVRMGVDKDLGVEIYLPDHIRSRHTHILGATGSGKTESVILNFIKQDVKRGLGSIILDAKGDQSFIKELESVVPADKLKVFDLADPGSLGYDPLCNGSPLESAQRLFSSLEWSEEYYKSKALSALQGIYQYHYELEDKNPQLEDLSHYLEDSERYSAALAKRDDKESKSTYKREYNDVLGLRDQINLLCRGHLGSILSPKGSVQINLEDSKNGNVIYFRLQSLISPQLVSILGRLLINNLNFLAGTAHRDESKAKEVKLIPTYLDEFASFACLEFADLISKARSAGLALHFSHQSIGDLSEVSKGFLNKITDNSATKIVLRINDPDSAEFMSRSFGTKIYQKITQRVTNSKEAERAESVGEGTVREAHQYRAPPDLLKTLPTGTGSVLIAHGEENEEGASAVFKIKFPKLEEKINEKVD